MTQEEARQQGIQMVAEFKAEIMRRRAEWSVNGLVDSDAYNRVAGEIIWAGIRADALAAEMKAAQP